MNTNNLFTYKNISPDSTNLFYSAIITGNNIEIVSGSREDLLLAGIAETELCRNKKELELTLIGLKGNASRRNMSAEELYNKIKGNREKRDKGL